MIMGAYHNLTVVAVIEPVARSKSGKLARKGGKKAPLIALLARFSSSNPRLQVSRRVLQQPPTVN
jgi:hypothetical protein